MRAALLLALMAGAAWGAAPRAPLSEEQAKERHRQHALMKQAARDWAAGKKAEALAGAEGVFQAATRAYGEYSWEAANVSSWLAQWERERGRLPEAAAHYGRTHRILARLWGEDNWRAVNMRLNRQVTLARAARPPELQKALDKAAALEGRAARAASRPHEAIPLLHQALELRKWAEGEKSPGYVTSLHDLARLYGVAGDGKKRLELASRGLDLNEAVFGARHPRHASALASHAALHAALGDHKTALPLARQALAIRKEALGEEHKQYADSLNALVLYLSAVGDFRSALPLARRAVELDRRLRGEWSADHVASLNNLAHALASMGDARAALPLYRRALSLTALVHGKQHPSYATQLQNLGAAHFSLGDHKAALPLYQQALELIRVLKGDRHPSYALVLNNIGLVYAEMGDYGAALPVYQHALKVNRAALGEKHPTFAASLINLGDLYARMKDREAALPLLKRALELEKTLRGERRPGYVVALNNLAQLHSDMGDHEAALPLFKQALALHRDLLGERHPRSVLSLHNLAGVLAKRGAHEDAVKHYQEALALRAEVLGRRHQHYALTLNNLAVLQFGRGDKGAALPLAEEGARLALTLLRDIAAVQSERQQLMAARDMSYRLGLRLSFNDAVCHGHALAWKGAILLRQRQRRLFSALSDDPETREAAGRLQEVARQIAALSTSARPSGAELDRLTGEQERLQIRLSGQSASARAAFEADALTPRALADALPEGAVLVDYLAYWRHGPARKDAEARWERHLAAFVSRKGRPPVRIDLGPARNVAEAVGRWRAALLRQEGGQETGLALKRMIWAPVEKHLEGAAVALVSPDRPLDAVPFAALPGRRRGAYLIEDLAVATVPVPQMLPEMLRPVDRAVRLKPSLLAVGDVDYDKAGEPGKRADDSRTAPAGLKRSWERLPGTFAEAAAVSKAFHRLFRGASVIDLSKGEATKKAVREALARVRYAHIATHGFFAPEPGEGPREALLGLHPLLLSGLALAGANREPKPGEEDGTLTALEVSEMALPKLELVVLSACYTGLGKPERGEGLLGLQRAFAVAGARTVIASLWAVDDRATQMLMSDFYRIAWDPDSVVSRAEALRQAQLSMLKEGSRRGIGKDAGKFDGGKPVPPYYWAAFVLSGDWR